MAVNDAFYPDSARDLFLNVFNGVAPAATMELYLLPSTDSAVVVGSTDAAALAACLHAASVLPGFQAIAAITGPPLGRRLAVDTKDFVIDLTGTADRIAISNGTNVVYVHMLSATAAVTSGQTWTMPAFNIDTVDYVA